MKLPQIISINGLLSIGLGIAFGLYAPLMMAFFGIADIPSDDVILYWNVASFARMYGAAMISYGLLLWALRKVSAETSHSTRRGILFALVFANVLGLFVAITQQVSVWQSIPGWVLSAYYAAFLVIYIYILAKKPGQETAN